MAYVLTMRPEELLCPSAAGLFCRPGGFHIDRPLLRGANANLNLTFAMASVFFVCWIVWAVQANGVFAILPEGAAERLQEDFRFYVWDEHTREVRWMCAWDTREEDVDAFVEAIAEVVASGSTIRPI